ncbi:hypothetical protein [Paraferrimonas sp. SM1919]|uniref:hypothetical protein n=1 Tax=Paraferrimonas sp. SM1919 TaxID=2662263 RepID=UPI0013D4252B|nr:hypothetical protein [Paraferrimonas sp. SM1919]
MITSATLKASLVMVLLALLQGCSSSDHHLAVDCGYISLQSKTQQHRYPVILTHINGQAVISKNTSKLPVGTYQLTLYEFIDSPKIHINPQLRTVLDVSVTLAKNSQVQLWAEMVGDGYSLPYWQIKTQTAAKLCELKQAAAQAD